MSKSQGDCTTAVRTGLCTDNTHGAVVPPLHLSSNFTFRALGDKRQHDYTRTSNPTRDLLAEALAELEGGAAAVVTSSGMSALHLLTFLIPKRGRVLAPVDCYGGTFRLLTALADKGQFEVTYVDFGNLTELASHFAQKVDLVLIETPSNPLLRVVDIAEIARLCKKHQTLLGVDNTFLSPALQKPIELGADIVIHSTTKYLNGHGDVVGGAVITADEKLGEELAWWANCTGLTGSPFDSYLTLRGLRTLYPRMRQHLENTEKLAVVLTQHPAVERVYYPGLSTHPGHEIAKRQQQGFGAIVSFELKGDIEAVHAFVGGLKYFTLAESLGGVESLIAHPTSMTHASMTPEARARAGISEQLLRLSVGIESSQDLQRDLEAALIRAHAIQMETARPKNQTPLLFAGNIFDGFAEHRFCAHGPGCDHSTGQS